MDFDMREEFDMDSMIFDLTHFDKFVTLDGELFRIGFLKVKKPPRTFPGSGGFSTYLSILFPALNL